MFFCMKTLIQPVVQSCNNNSSTNDPVASEFLSPNDTPDKLNPISIVHSFGPKQPNEPKKINPLNLKLIGSLPLINLSKSPIYKYTASWYSEREKKINSSPNLELTGNLPFTDLPKRPKCTDDRNGGKQKRINNNYKPSGVGSESRSLIESLRNRARAQCMTVVGYQIHFQGKWLLSGW